MTRLKFLIMPALFAGTLIAALAALFAAAPARAQTGTGPNLIVNGNFSDGLAGWNTKGIVDTDSDGDWPDSPFVVITDPDEDLDGAGWQPWFNPSIISQTVTITGPGTVSLSWDIYSSSVGWMMMFYPAGTEQLVHDYQYLYPDYIDGNGEDSLGYYIWHHCDLAFESWENCNWTFYWDQGPGTLVFFNGYGGTDLLLDNIALTTVEYPPTPTPTPTNTPIPTMTPIATLDWSEGGWEWSIPDPIPIPTSPTTMTLSALEEQMWDYENLSGFVSTFRTLFVMARENFIFSVMVSLGMVAFVFNWMVNWLAQRGDDI